MFPHLKKIALLFFIVTANYICAQTTYSYNISTTIEGCVKATARLDIIGTIPADTVKIDWSLGYSDTRIIYDLTGGEHSVYVRIKHATDSVPLIKDTLLFFTIDKEDCLVQIEKYFSPNGDNYNDELNVTNSNYYPDFELNIYNKWGQRVHHQRSKYTPWDGTWLGTDLPDGTYYYVFFYDAGKPNRLVKGDVTIIR